MTLNQNSLEDTLTLVAKLTELDIGELQAAMLYIAADISVTRSKAEKITAYTA